jgi:hypothetical protein
VLGQEDFALGRVDEKKDIGPSIQNDSMMRRDDLREVVNLQKLFNLVVYLPGGEAMVKRLIHLPRNPAFDFTLLFFLWYQHAVVSGYGMLDDMRLGFKNVGQIFGKSGSQARRSFIDTLDMGSDATV